ncbi:MAG: hypothetical protein AB1640_02430 [bacterium]
MYCRKHLSIAWPAVWVLLLGIALLSLEALAVVETQPPEPGRNPSAAAPGSVDPLSPPSDSAEERCRGGMQAGISGPRLYDVELGLEVTGSIRFLTRTRYYRSEDLRLTFAAVPDRSKRLLLSARGLSDDPNLLHFGIGEGPKKHQRYVLLGAEASQEERRLIEQRILAEEKIRGCEVADDAAEEEPHSKGPAEGDSPREDKKAFFNYYLWRDPAASFTFQWAPSGEVALIENRVRLDELSGNEGSRAHPRFFEILEFALYAIPPFLESPGHLLEATRGETGWQVDCGPVLEGLVRFCEGVYERKMALLEPASPDRPRAVYRAHPVPATSILRIRGTLPEPVRTQVRISGFKGEIRIESLRREILFDFAANRILKDEFDISFGVERDKKVLAVAGEKNRVHVTIVDRCFTRCPDTDDGIRVAHRDCGLPEGGGTNPSP